VGYLVAVGKGWINCEDTVAVLNARDRTKAQSTAPAHGLFLVDVKHGDFEI
jgi:tRNA U38,U39,U40 pseudouridine synthase TruA